MAIAFFFLYIYAIAMDTCSCRNRRFEVIYKSYRVCMGLSGYMAIEVLNQHGLDSPMYTSGRYRGISCMGAGQKKFSMHGLTCTSGRGIYVWGVRPLSVL
jgi:hypothetical protein